MFSEIKSVFRKTVIIAMWLVALVSLYFLGILLGSIAVFVVNTIDTTFMQGTFHSPPFYIHGDISFDIPLADVLRYCFGKPPR